MGGLVSNIIMDMIHANRQQALMEQNQAYEKQKNDREFHERAILGPAVEQGDLETLKQYEKVTKQYFPKETIDLLNQRAEYNQQSKKLQRTMQTLQGIMGVVNGQQGGPAPQPTNAPAYDPAGDILSGKPPPSAATFRAMGPKEITNYTDQTAEDMKTALQPTESGHPSMQEVQARRSQGMQPQGAPTQPPVQRFKRTINIGSDGKVGVTLTEVDAETAKSDATVLSVQNRIHQGLKTGTVPNLQDIMMEEQNRTGVALKPEQVENIAKSLYGASFEAAMQELERMNRSGKVKLTEAQMFAAASQHAARSTGMRGIPQATQGAVSPETVKLPETLGAQLYAGSGQTPQSATPAGVAGAFEAQALQAAKQQYVNEEAQLQARLANAPLPEGIQQKVEPLMSARRQTERIYDIFSRKPYLVGKGFTDAKNAIQQAMIQQEGAPKDETWKYQNGALLNSISGFMGKADPEAIELYKSIADLSDTILRARSGAQINEQEYRRLSGLLFSKWDEPATFKAGLDRVREELRSSIENKVGLAVTPGAQVLQGVQGGQPGAGMYAPRPSPYAPAGRPAQPMQPLQQLPPGYPPQPENNPALRGKAKVDVSIDDATKIAREFRNAFSSTISKGGKITESQLAEFLVRKGHAKTGPEAKEKADVLLSLWAKMGKK